MTTTSPKTNGQQVIARIGFAEQWLDRAKRHCQDGDVPRGLMTLVLANAEVTHTLRMAHPAPVVRRSWIVPAFAIAAASALAVVALTEWDFRPPVPPSIEMAPPIVTFQSPTGALLKLAGMAQVQMNAPVGGDKTMPPPARLPQVRAKRFASAGKSVLPPPAPTSGRRQDARTSVPVGAEKAAAPLPPAVLPSGSSAPSVAESTPSEVELIDLVLTAERTLRTQTQP